jgi:hypothetical protein
VTKRTEEGGGTARTEAWADARLLDLAARCCPDLRLHGGDEANLRFNGAGTTD